MSRSTKLTHTLCGIDTTVFSLHSTRAASASKGFAKAVPVREIIARAGWSSAQTFYKYYNKPIIDKGSATSVLLISH